MDSWPFIEGKKTIKTVLAGLVMCLFAGPTLAQEYSLTAPERAYSRQRIEVGWTAPRQDGGLLEIRSGLESTSRANYAYIRSNPQGIEVPEAPGEYQLVFIHDREVKASRPLTVFLPEAFLEAPDKVGAGESFDVSWRGPNSRQDNVTFAKRGGSMIRGTSYAYVGNSKSDKVSLRAPADAGDYDIIYLSGSTVLARVPITVNTVSAALTAPGKVHYLCQS